MAHSGALYISEENGAFKRRGARRKLFPSLSFEGPGYISACLSEVTMSGDFAAGNVYFSNMQ